MVVVRWIVISIAYSACSNVPWKPIRLSGRNDAPLIDRKSRRREPD